MFTKVATKKRKNATDPFLQQEFSLSVLGYCRDTMVQHGGVPVRGAALSVNLFILR